MSFNHAISNLVCSINNASAIQKPTAIIPYAKICESILKILHQEGFIAGYEVFEVSKNIRKISITLKYVARKSSISDFKVISKPGRRTYSKIVKLKSFYDGLGFKILSTPKGVITDRTAKELNVGGEELCAIF